jgi:hypothetical protein
MSFYNKSILKYMSKNNRFVKYIDNLINKMFCLFFTWSSGGVVFTNRSAKEFLEKNDDYFDKGEDNSNSSTLKNSESKTVI